MNEPQPDPQTIELPPLAFVEALQNWKGGKGRGVKGPFRQSKEWAMFKAGYNAAVAASNAATRARYALPAGPAMRPRNPLNGSPL